MHGFISYCRLSLSTSNPYTLSPWLAFELLETMIIDWQDVLQGTQLLAIDVGAATGLLRQAIMGDELTKKERKFLRRTLTDLVSVVPIGILMLLPVSILA